MKEKKKKKEPSKLPFVFRVVLEIHVGIVSVFKMKPLLSSCFTFKLNTSMLILTPLSSKVPAAENNLFPGYKSTLFCSVLTVGRNKSERTNCHNFNINIICGGLLTEKGYMV